MKQPVGFEQFGPDYVCKLNRSLYGLKQAARVWNQKLHSTLLNMGFKRLDADRSIYLYVRDDVRIVMPIHVDDITLASNSEQALDHFVKDLSQHFKLRDLGSTSYLLGIEITRDRPNRTISLCQRQYIISLLNGTNSQTVIQFPLLWILA
ncbi:MAG TPA: reverse transcriptase domain-containing protein, partial [Stellaceae bacterium]|nr:reverse transcriptase domain-containing protein [Stellaceae bacterium]